MSDWTLPLISDRYDLVLAEISARLNDIATLFNSIPNLGQPPNSIRFDPVNLNFAQFVSGNWIPLVISVSGGGTGGGTPGAARVSLGLGSMAIQNANSVSISGGVIPGGIIAPFVPPTSLGTGTPAANTVLYGDGIWKFFNLNAQYTILNKSAGYVVTLVDLQSKTLIKVTGSTTITLPLTTVAGVNGLSINIKNMDTVNSTIVNSTSPDTIEKQAVLTIPPGRPGGFFSYTLVADTNDTNWAVV